MGKILSWALALVALCAAITAAEAGDKKIRVVLIDGQNNGSHNWRATTPVMKKALLESGKFSVDVASNLRPGDRAPEGWQSVTFPPDLGKYDVVVSNYNGAAWPKDFDDALNAQLKAGKIGLVIVHAANNSFGGWKDYHQMIGMGWYETTAGPRLYLDENGKSVRVPAGTGDRPGHRFTGKFNLVLRDAEHPITKGMPLDWAHNHDELYDNLRGPIDNVHLLATAYSKGTNVHEPMIWTVSYGKGRVFHTPMGHDVNAMRCVGFQATLNRGTEWAATGSVSLPLPINFPTADKLSVVPVDSSLPGYFPPNLFLVRATTVEVKKAEPPNELGSFVITHVYAGGSSLKGKTFECETSRMQMGSGFGDGNYRHVHFLEKDTDGLWWLYFDPKEKKLRAELRGNVVDAYQIRRFPITNGKLGTKFEFEYKPDRKAEWKQGLAWAEAVEAVYLAKSDDERAVILRRLTATVQSPVAGWAINLLGNVNPKGTTEFLKKLAANEELSAESHVVLDKTLSRLDYPRWRSSDHWERLLTRWVESADLSYFKAGVGRLREACRNDEIDFALYAKILDPVLARADRLKDGQEEWLGFALSQPPGDRAQAFDWLTGYVRNGKTAFVRANAAAGFQVLGTPNAAQMRTLHTLRQESTEPQVQKALDGVLKPR